MLDETVLPQCANASMNFSGGNAHALSQVLEDIAIRLVEDKQVDICNRAAALGQQAAHQVRHRSQGETEDLAAIHEEVVGTAYIAVFILHRHGGFRSSRTARSARRHH